METDTRLRRAGRVYAAAILCGAALLLLPAVASAESAPYTECPAVGVDTSCETLIVVNKNGTFSAFSDPSQGPYDGDDDTLIGIKNESDETIHSIHLKGENIFGFDGDGICSGLYEPAPPACPYGSTGYEGPNTAFEPEDEEVEVEGEMITEANAGNVVFPEGLAPGASTYFSLEENINFECSGTSCEGTEGPSQEEVEKARHEKEEQETVEKEKAEHEKAEHEKAEKEKAEKEKAEEEKEHEEEGPCIASGKGRFRVKKEIQTLSDNLSTVPGSQERLTFRWNKEGQHKLVLTALTSSHCEMGPHKKTFYGEGTAKVNGANVVVTFSITVTKRDKLVFTLRYKNDGKRMSFHDAARTTETITTS